MGADFCFNVYDGKRALMVAASSQDEKVQWMEDIVETVQVKQYLHVYICMFFFYIYIVLNLFHSNLLILSYTINPPKIM